MVEVTARRRDDDGWTRKSIGISQSSAATDCISKVRRRRNLLDAVELIKMLGGSCRQKVVAHLYVFVSRFRDDLVLFSQVTKKG